MSPEDSLSVYVCMNVSVTYEHMPMQDCNSKEQEATNWNKGSMLGKKFYFLYETVRGRETEQNIFLARPDQMPEENVPLC